MEVRLLKLWETVITLKSPIHEAKFPTAVNAQNDDDCDYYYYVLIVARNLHVKYHRVQRRYEESEGTSIYQLKLHDT